MQHGLVVDPIGKAEARDKVCQLVRHIARPPRKHLDVFPHDLDVGVVAHAEVQRQALGCGPVVLPPPGIELPVVLQVEVADRLPVADRAGAEGQRVPRRRVVPHREHRVQRVRRRRGQERRVEVAVAEAAPLEVEHVVREFASRLDVVASQDVIREAEIIADLYALLPDVLRLIGGGADRVALHLVARRPASHVGRLRQLTAGKRAALVHDERIEPPAVTQIAALQLVDPVVPEDLRELQPALVRSPHGRRGARDVGSRAAAAAREKLVVRVVPD